MSERGETSVTVATITGSTDLVVDEGSEETSVLTELRVVELKPLTSREGVQKLQTQEGTMKQTRQSTL